MSIFLIYYIRIKFKVTIDNNKNPIRRANYAATFYFVMVMCWSIFYLRVPPKFWIIVVIRIVPLCTCICIQWFIVKVSNICYCRSRKQNYTKHFNFCIKYIKSKENCMYMYGNVLFHNIETSSRTPGLEGEDIICW